jgi:phosphoenolpyruvate carboxylase
MPAALRADVRLLGELLGQVVLETDGPDLLADVERLRRAAIAGRDGHQEAAAELESGVAGFDLRRAEQVARAFTVYFHLVNLAEERQRARALRERDRPGEAPSGSLAATVKELRREGRTEPVDMLPGLRLHPVITAHPTEARRRAVATAVLRIGAELDRWDRADAGASERADARRSLLEEISILWRTAQLRAQRPGPLDEVRTAMAVFDQSLFRVVPALYRALDRALDPDGSGTRPSPVPAYLRLGSWVGGDRDGNPHVTADVTREAVAIQSEHVLLGLEQASRRIGRSLTLSTRTTPPSQGLRAALADAAAAHPAVLADLRTTSPDEPHRQFLLYLSARIVATRRRQADLAYRRASELVADLRLLQHSLAAAGAARVAYGEVQHLLWQAETFGFHLAEIEVRQHSQVHAKALAELLPGAVPDAAQLDRLALHGWPPVPPDGELSAATRDVLDSLRVMVATQERFGPEACRRYVVSFTRSAADLAAVSALARLANGDRSFALDVVPLLESEEDLRRATEVLEEYVALPSVAARLQDDSPRLEVMLGYSDSTKEVGPVGATLILYDAQAALTAWARRHGIELTLFHGRGGALGRGGGPANRAVLSQAPGSVDGSFKVTEQGEVVFARYGNPVIAQRHLEQVTSAVLLASTQAVEERARLGAERFGDLGERIGKAATSAYRSLVDFEGFPAFFAAVSPLEEVGALPIGSRPARRGGAEGLSDLRAIPWVFAWAQTRCNLPGWYGLGTGLETALSEPAGLDRLRAAYRDWPLFNSLIDNAEMSLAKADPSIAARYLSRAGRPELAEAILEEMRRTIALVLEVTGHQHLLAGRPVLSWAVTLRNPYVDVLSHLQLRALRELRSGIPDEATAERLRDLVLLTVNGVAAGLQNTG